MNYLRLAENFVVACLFCGVYQVYVKFFGYFCKNSVEARIRIGWNKFRQLVPLLTNKDVSLRKVVQQLCEKQHVTWK